ncbi:siderophore-interacting protein [Cellulomonas fimi]|uniref:Siderophore-interacting protein n=1 Tax=Cellulomonas fimi TaxID=1708 RepID=A0A7Y0LZ58_CELFI|nr:siderophore-interacting protein [Cellulomonas fimi]
MPLPPAVRHLTVVGVRRVTPRMVRVTLTGEELAGYAAIGPTDHLKVFFPDPASGALVAPTLADGALRPPSEGRPLARDYTPRAFRPDGASGGPELDLDLVVHDDGGPASTWAERAAPGDRLVTFGPKSTKPVPAGFDTFLLLGDETALPSIARWLERLPQGARARVLAEVGSAEDSAYLDDVTHDAQVDWLVRDGAPGTSRVLDEAIRAHGPIGARTFVWAGGEAGSLVGVRRHLRRVLELAPHQVQVQGYWRRGTADFDHHAPLDPSDGD